MKLTASALVLSEISSLELRHLAPPAAGLCKTGKRKQRSSKLDAVFSFSFCGEDESITFVAFCLTLSHKTPTEWFKREILSILALYQRLCKTSYFNAVFSSWCIFYG